MTATILRGPWLPRAARPEGRPFASLTRAEQIRWLVFARYDLRRYWPDLDANERGWLRAQLGARPLRPEALDPQERARVAAVVGLVLRRRAGWAA